MFLFRFLPTHSNEKEGEAQMPLTMPLTMPPMSSDFEDDDQYTPTIDDKLTHGKVVRSSVSAHDRIRKA